MRDTTPLMVAEFDLQRLDEICLAAFPTAMDPRQRGELRLREVRHHLRHENRGMVLERDSQQKADLFLDKIFLRF